MNHFKLGNPFPQLFRNSDSIVDVCFWQGYNEFFSAYSTNDVTFANIFYNIFTDILKNKIADIVSKRIIHLFKMININV
ncbi:MAG: hypothetical protein A2Z99_08045 [Treponema sp. GWB1_62_6]|nr:MAG: hypothetical protein A2Y36_15160 [Treponema sp. GWA1_62_8]OHE63387.1 MAG: hypothetical protein A2Z99_08045 [Treponema sp. GWB1_62_6]OHE65053.1 MAG: hypothetical protein A2001_17775 [Treponema sp. GWC1_61_84]OHE72459.1 MAG: hypothetical protein A2413_03900 [Treponema sp. RIFOXYC1_FULL_61_9]